MRIPTDLDPPPVAQIAPLILDPDFTPAAIEKASKACKAMCMWVRAMDTYHKVVLMVEPKKALLGEASAELEVVMGKLAEAQATLKGVMDKIAMLEAQFSEANAKKLDLERQMEEATGRLERAGILTASLGSESVRWTDTCARLSAEFENLIGDSLVSAATIAYAGTFTPDFRSQLVETWCKALVEYKIPHTPGCKIQSTIKDDVLLRSWKLCELPQDNHSLENGIIMDQARRYSLFIDPQGQANKFIKNMGKQVDLFFQGAQVGGREGVPAYNSPVYLPLNRYLVMRTFVPFLLAILPAPKKNNNTKKKRTPPKTGQIR